MNKLVKPTVAKVLCPKLLQKQEIMLHLLTSLEVRGRPESAPHPIVSQPSRHPEHVSMRVCVCACVRVCLCVYAAP